MLGKEVWIRTVLIKVVNKSKNKVMISKLVKDLEIYKGRIQNYSDIISQVLVRNPKEAEMLLEMLIDYLRLNKDLKIIELTELSSTGLNLDSKYLRFLITTEFKCSWCDNLVQEQINLSASSQPLRSEGKPVCMMCREKAEDQRDEPDYDEPDYDREYEEYVAKKTKEIKPEKLPDF